MTAKTEPKAAAKPEAQAEKKTGARKVRFTADYDHIIPMGMVAYKADTVEHVKAEAADRAIELGKAVEYDGE